MRVLVACEFSGIVRDAFAKRGHDAMSCDLLPTERPGKHYQGDVFDIINDGWDLMIAHPPCIYLCIANAPMYNFKRYGRDKVIGRISKRDNAIYFFNKLQHADIKRICIENPLPMKVLTDICGKYTQIVHPYYFGESFSKTTCLWLKGLPLLKSTKIVDRGEFIKGTGKRTNPVWRDKCGKENRSKFRSKTFHGIAEAMAEQWGGENEKGILQGLQVVV